MRKNVIQQIAISGMLTGLAILVGSFLNFHLIGKVYLIGIVIFAMPLFLRIDFLIISTLISVSITDVITGYGTHTWISMIVYTVAVLVLWLSKMPQFKLFYIIGLIIAAGIVIIGYFGLEYKMFGKAYAIKSLAGTAIEMAIVLPVVSILYFPLKVLGKVF